MRRNKIDIISLGCSKNLVDSEHLLRQFQAAGYKVSHNADRIDGETVVVNTCGFIADAQQESIDTILRLGEAKREGKIRNLFVMGCLSERFRADLIEALPEVDRFYGKFDWKGMLADLEIISVGYDFLRSLGITEFELRINSVGCPKCREG